MLPDDANDRLSYLSPPAIIGVRLPTRPDQPHWIRAGGPSQTAAAICCHTVWIRPPSPMTSRMRIVVPAVGERRPSVRFCGQQSRSQQRARAMDDRYLVEGDLHTSC